MYPFFVACGIFNVIINFNYSCARKMPPPTGQSRYSRILEVTRLYPIGVTFRRYIYRFRLLHKFPSGSGRTMRTLLSLLHISYLPSAPCYYIRQVHICPPPSPIFIALASTLSSLLLPVVIYLDYYRSACSVIVSQKGLASVLKIPGKDRLSHPPPTVLIGTTFFKRCSFFIAQSFNESIYPILVEIILLVHLVFQDVF